MKRNKSYIKKYIEEYGCIPIGFNIHHIDINYKNNLLTNLVAIPIELHSKYHYEEKYMIDCFKKNNEVGFKYHRDKLIEYYNQIKTYDSYTRK